LERGEGVRNLELPVNGYLRKEPRLFSSVMTVYSLSDEVRENTQLFSET
jgi:hypothetical protein